MRSRLLIAGLLIFSGALQATTLRVATFNVSMESDNYVAEGQPRSGDVLAQALATGDHPQIRNIAEIIQRVDPDIILLNEFDYIANPDKGVKAFIRNYLNVSQHGQKAVDYPYFYLAPVNTGHPTPFDLNNDGKYTQYGDDAFGYGVYEGQYAMVLLSKFPIQNAHVRSLQTFPWHAMPGAQAPIDPQSGKPWYNEQEWQAMRLSSKSHWDVPVDVNGKRVHVLAMHPTPPTFDGPEDRNGKRNHDEIRLMADYLSPAKSQYIVDDSGQKGGLSASSRFVLAGDFNASDSGDKHRPDVIEQLTENPLVNNALIPVSEGAKEQGEGEHHERYTAYWGARADYVLPSQFGFKVKGAGVFWPTTTSDLFRLVKDRKASSDHRLVWVDLTLTD